jgi:hypothetical protein
LKLGPTWIAGDVRVLKDRLSAVKIVIGAFARMASPHLPFKATPVPL